MEDMEVAGNKELRINIQGISHIKLYDGIKGFESYTGSIKELVYHPTKYFRFLWLFPILSVEEGWYLKGESPTSFNKYFNSEKLPVNYYSIDDEVYSYPKIEIFAGKEKLKTKYFKTYRDAKNYVTSNFPNVDITL